jgi:tetratricopeptide (TPR) repeat protein
MSLIVDALKRAQQLRLKESKETPFSTPSPDRNEGLRRLRKRWTMIGISLASLIALFLMVLKMGSSPSPPMPAQTSIHAELKNSNSVNPVKNSNRVFNPTGNILKSDPAADQRDIISNRVSKQKPLELLKDIMSLPKDVMNLPRDTQISAKITPPPRILSSPLKVEDLREKEIAPVKRIELKQEVDKDHSWAYEVLTHFNLGVQLYQLRNYTKAIQSYQRVIQLDPYYIEAYNNLGIIYQELGDFDKAFSAYQKSIEINPHYEKGYNNLGILYYLQGHNEEAFDSFKKALAINSNSTESHINLGVLFKKQGQWDKAIESYRNALTINPRLREVHYNIALLYEQSGNIEPAIGHYLQFISLSSANHTDLVSKVQRHLDDLMKTETEIGK